MKFNLGQVLKVLVCFCALVLITSCSSSKSKIGGLLNLDTDLKLEFEVSSDVNPDENKKPSPIFVRFYQLKSPVAFNKADFIDLFDRDSELLAADLLNKQILKPLAPGEKRTERMVLTEGTSEVALYAEFSQYSGAKFKLIFPVTENNVIRNRIKVRISGTEMTLIKD